jgi:PhnB protein
LEDDMAFLPYLNFGGNCREAFTQYQEIFGGELTLLPLGEMPGADPMPAEVGDRIMHAALKLPDGSLLMASDSEAGVPFGPVQGMYVNCTVPDLGEGKRVFDALAEGGTVEMAFAETFWSPGFGVCVDRHGTPWMVNVEPAA